MSEILDGRLPGDPTAVALIHERRAVTRGELAQRVSELAGALRRSLPAGALVATWLPNGPEILALHLACFRAGFVPMPLNLGLKWPEVRRILEHARAAALVTRAAMAEAHGAELAGLVERLWVDPIEGLSAPEGPPLPADEARLALVLHTSGSSARPKGVALSRGALRHTLAYRLAHTGLGPDSLSVVASCLSQSVGLYQSLAMLAAGGTLVLLESYDVDAMAEHVNRHEPTHLIMVVDAFDRLLHHPRITATSFVRTTFAAAGADRMTARVQDRFFALTGRQLSGTYGLTESSWALVNRGDRRDTGLALGEPCPDVEIRLLGPLGREVERGEVGEIHIRSPRTMLGYWNDERATRAVLADGWLATGDLAYTDAGGTFWFAGRSKDVIVLATGDNVSPAEVEDVLLTHPSVTGCAVVGRTSATGAAVPWALVTRRDETEPAALRAFLQERLSDYKVPWGIEIVLELPVGASGKIRRTRAADGTS